MRSVPLLHRADLHVHTTHSDGACTPGDVVRSAWSVGLTALAITDHDTLTALPSAGSEAARLGIELISGVELTAEFESREVHILGHFFRDDDGDLVAATRRLSTERAERIERMAERLRAIGLRIDLDAVRRTFPRATLGRKHLADWLVVSRQVSDVRSAFDLYLGDDRPGFVPKARLSAETAIALIRGAGGVAGLAHPPFNLRRESLDALVAFGLGSIEVAGPGVNAKRGVRWAEWAEERRLVPIAGSDFHAPDRPGRWVGSVTTPGPTVERLRAASRL